MSRVSRPTFGEGSFCYNSPEWLRLGPVLWSALWLVGPGAPAQAAVGGVVAGGVAGAVAARGWALQLLAALSG